MTAKATPLAYSYVRFSTPEQAKGDSLRRQTEAAAGWCERNNVRLDTGLTFHDLGKSAFRGGHHKDDKHALGAFIKLAESGRVPPDSFLIIERLDRLTREDVNDALELFLRLKKLVRIVQLYPVEVIHDARSNPMQLMMALVELMRGRDESLAKSERGLANWVAKRRRARENGERVTDWLPGWLEEGEDGELRLIPERAAAVREIFALSAAGYGNKAIVKRLTERGVKPFRVVKQKPGNDPYVTGDHWTTSYVSVILRDRRALGEYQPKDRHHKADGEPIPGYFPAVVTERDWDLTRAEARQRLVKRGRVGEHVNLFAGLVKDARSGESYFAVTRNDEGGRRHVLINFDATQGRGKCHAFPLAVFEEAFLRRLAEVDPREIVNGDDGSDELKDLSAEYAQLENRIAELEQELRGGVVKAAVKVLRELETRRDEVAALLPEARYKADHPLTETWGEALTLAKALKGAKDPRSARLRLRSAIRRIVREIWLLVVPRGKDRLCYIQVYFAGAHEGKRRSYLLWYRPARSNGKGARQRAKGWVQSWVHGPVPDFLDYGEVDLTKRDEATQLGKDLLGMSEDEWSLYEAAAEDWPIDPAP